MNATYEPRSVRFRKERLAEWQDLDGLVERALRRGLSGLTEDELHRLPALYRAAVSSLAVARKTAMDRALVAYLEALAARGYLAIYGSRRPERAPLVRFFLYDFPARVRQLAGSIGLSFLCLALGTALSYVLVLRDPEWFFAFVGEGLAGGRTPAASTEYLRSVLYERQTEGLSVFASFLFTHNARIGLLAFALGFAAGVPSALLVFTNGLMLGAFVALYASRGLLVPILGWLLPHGVPEIGAIILCGGAGIHIGRAVLAPGERTVREALRMSGREAAVVVAGSVLLFAVAGLVEGVFRQTVTSDLIRFSVFAFNLAWLAAWILLPKRKEDAWRLR